MQLEKSKYNATVHEKHLFPIPAKMVHNPSGDRDARLKTAVLNNTAAKIFIKSCMRLHGCGPML